jgi:putative colanic acid biosynthesis acetyltransferase WcaF
VVRYNEDTHTSASFSFSDRFKRVVWNVAAGLLFHTSPRPLHVWRAFLLRLFGAKVGRGVHVYPGVKIWAPWNLELGDECGIATGAIIYSQGKVFVGRRAVISQGAHLCAGTHDYTKPGFPLVTRPIYIGNNAWVAAESFIHAGVKVGDGCVIGARSVVTKNMPPWMVCAGHPCAPIKDREMDTTINAGSTPQTYEA